MRIKAVHRPSPKIARAFIFERIPTITLTSIISLVLLSIVPADAVPQNNGNNRGGNGNGRHEKFVESRVLVKFRNGSNSENKEQALRPFGGRIDGEIENTGVHVIRLPQGMAAQAVAEAMSHNPVVEFAELDQYVAPEKVPNDPYYSNEWHLGKVQAPAAWDITTGNSGV